MLHHIASSRHQLLDLWALFVLYECHTETLKLGALEVIDSSPCGYNCRRILLYHSTVVPTENALLDVLFFFLPSRKWESYI